MGWLATRSIFAIFVCAAGANLWAADLKRVSGKVLDENGAPVADARITVNGGSVTTDAAGQFIVSIPVAGDYGLRAECVGFYVFATDAVRLEEGSPVEIRLNHQKDMTQSIDVKYSPPTVDPAQTSDAQHLTNQEILNIPYPAAQDFRASLPLFGGVVQDTAGQMHFNGGDARQTNYRLNGFDMSDPATGGLAMRLNVDTVQTLEWQAIRYSPENGKGSAGTLDVRTEMGDDHWTFSGTNFVPGFGSREGFHLDRWNPRVKVSGPIAGGRAWVHDAFDMHYTLDTINGLPPGEDRTRALNGSNLARVQWNLTNRHILTGGFLTNLAQDRRHGLSFLDPAQTTSNTRNALYMGSLKDQISIGTGLLEIGFAATSASLRSSPQGGLPYVITPMGRLGNYFIDSTRHSGRQELLANVFLKPIQRRGSHQIQFGVDAMRGTFDQTNNRHEFTVVALNNIPVRTVDFLGNPRRVRKNNEVYGYAVDRWNPYEGLTLELGFRTQWDQYSNGAPPAPRLSVAYAPKWLHGTKVSGGWGIFYDPLHLDVLSLGQDQISVSTYFKPDGSVAGAPVRTQILLRPSTLRLPKFTLTSFSLERELPFSLYGRVNLVAREGSRGITFLSDFVQETQSNDYTLGNIRRERYRSAEFSLKRVFASKYEWFGSYTRSNAHSNAAVDFTIENPVFARQAGGPLPWDTPNRFLMWGWAPVEKKWFPRFLRGAIGEMSLSGLLDYRTGFPFSALTETGYMVGGPNSFRYPAFCSLNIALERKFAFRQYLWAWRVGVVNALDRANPNVVNNDANSPQFLRFGQGQARALNVRFRFLGRK